MLLVGLLLVGLGIFSFKLISFGQSQPQVEIIKEPVAEELIVEVAGEVLKAGVYYLPVSSRINDLLILAGGLAENADREWVTKNINLAQKLNDGDKIYIPALGENSQKNDQVLGGKINLNTASIQELDSL